MQVYLRSLHLFQGKYKVFWNMEVTLIVASFQGNIWKACFGGSISWRRKANLAMLRWDYISPEWMSKSHWHYDRAPASTAQFESGFGRRTLASRPSLMRKLIKWSHVCIFLYEIMTESFMLIHASRGCQLGHQYALWYLANCCCVYVRSAPYGGQIDFGEEAYNWRAAGNRCKNPEIFINLRCFLSLF